MNLLIVGGLLAVGIAAILGVVFLSMSEQRAEVRRRTTLPQQPTTPERSEPVTRRLVNEPATTRSRSNLPAAGETSLSTRGTEELLPSLNGQFHEMANEIRSLHEQAWQLEQRLGTLTEMIGHIERRHSSNISIEEESPSSDTSHAVD